MNDTRGEKSALHSNGEFMKWNVSNSPVEDGISKLEVNKDLKEPESAALIENASLPEDGSPMVGQDLAIKGSNFHLLSSGTLMHAALDNNLSKQ